MGTAADWSGYMPRDTRPDWDTYFLNIASAVATRGECRRLRVGAVIVRDNRIVATGYNGAPAGDENCLDGHCPRGLKAFSEEPDFRDGNQNFDNCIAIHAEANAIIHGEYERMRDGTVYITVEPCFSCLKLIRGAGLIRIVTPERVISLTGTGQSCDTADLWHMG